MVGGWWLQWIQDRGGGGREEGVDVCVCVCVCARVCGGAQCRVGEGQPHPQLQPFQGRGTREWTSVSTSILPPDTHNWEGWIRLKGFRVPVPRALPWG